MLEMNHPPGSISKELSWRLVLIFAAMTAVSCLLFVLREEWFMFWSHPMTKLLPEGSLPIKGFNPDLNGLIKLSVMTGLFPVLPFILYHVRRFLENGRAEKKAPGVFPFLFWSSLVFFLGAGLCYFLVLPPIARSFVSFAFGDRQNVLIMEAFLPLACKFTFAFGVACALPVIFFFFGKGGIVDYGDLSRSRRLAVVALFSVAALFTPPDLISLWMLGVPLVIVCEMCFQAVRISEKKAVETASPGSISMVDTLRTRSRFVLSIFALVILGLVFVDGYPSLGVTEVIFIVVLPFLIETIYVVTAAFRNNILQGFLCLLIPFYAPYFVLGKGSVLFRGRWFTKTWAWFTCLATLYGILRIVGIV